ncbi:tail assembly chaperone [Mycobacterium phage Keshu]|uniref:Tail assembly chaperone n=1 Tax=Mycobacterium phage Keshu TaxID=1567471 RepID=A0A0B5A362_9CAUD|nr:tail assembly chaperone [Mycobacterium phage Keshu]AJD82239.1 tail assembly chaperone [Mycobacterium phage Keshu]
MSENMTEADVDQVEPVEAPEDEQTSIAAEWAQDYPEGAQLFVGKFDAEEFDDEYGVADFPEGATIAVKRCLRKPPPGWIRQHAHLSDMQRTFALIEMHASERALEILDSLQQKPWDDFVEAWGRDGGLIEGKIAQVCAAFRSVEKLEDAFRRDLLVTGREFDDGTLSWDDLYAYIFAAPPGTAVYHAFEKGWTTTDYLLAHLIDGQNWLNWTKTEAAEKNPKAPPERFPRPGDEAREKQSDGTVSVGTTAATKTTVGNFLKMRAEREQRWREKHGQKGD